MPFTDPPPDRDNVIEVDRDGKPLLDANGKPRWIMGRIWINYIRTLISLLNVAPGVVAQAFAYTQSAAVPSTPIPGPALTAGFYRVSYFLRCVQAAGVSSAFQVTFSFLQGAVPLTKVGTNVNGNTTASFDQGTFFFKIDSPGPLSYAVSYASVGAPVAQFNVDVIVEAINLP